MRNELKCQNTTFLCKFFPKHRVIGEVNYYFSKNDPFATHSILTILLPQPQTRMERWNNTNLNPDY